MSGKDNQFTWVDRVGAVQLGAYYMREKRMTPEQAAWEVLKKEKYNMSTMQMTSVQLTRFQNDIQRYYATF